MFDKAKQLVKALWANDVVERAVWTALQAGLVVWAATGFTLDGATFGAVGGAMLSALKTFTVNYVKGRRG